MVLKTIPRAWRSSTPSSELARNDLLGAVVCLPVPDLTRSAGININERLLLRGRKDRLG